MQASGLFYDGGWRPGSEASANVNTYLPVTGAYHIRVLIPTYKEPVGIVKKTVEAMRAAVLPEGALVSQTEPDLTVQSLGILAAIGMLESRHYNKEVTAAPRMSLLFRNSTRKNNICVQAATAARTCWTTPPAAGTLRPTACHFQYGMHFTGW